MNRRRFLQSLGLAGATLATSRLPVAAASGGKPNFIVIFTDDQGYQDLGCFGAPKLKTPHTDRMAKEGMRFTDFYSGASVCTPSRAALLTGCYPERVGNLPVLFPRSNIGLNPEETTIAKMLKANGYATACVGKWHLGFQKEFLPTSHGFDHYFGVPYSNDMWLAAGMAYARDAKLPEGITAEDLAGGEKKKNDVPLLRDTEVVDYPVDQRTLTQRYTQEAVTFITANKDKPFFLYLPHTMPHIPLYASDAFRGKSDMGLYGDAIEEIDWSTGQILDTLRKLGIDKRTMVVYSADNGPWKLAQGCWVKGNMNRRVGGSAAPLKGYKFSRWEGGMREPTVMWWPGRIPAGKECSEVAGSIDLLPTFAALSGAKLPEKPIDGKSIIPLIEGRSGAKTPHEAYFYRTEAVRSGKWKLKKNELFDLESDIGETKNVAAQNPEVVARLKKLLDDHKKDLAANRRPPGKTANPVADDRQIKGLPGWRIQGGSFRLQKGVLKQTALLPDTAIFAPKAQYGDFTLEVMFRAWGGTEGCRVMVRAKDTWNYTRWSIGAFKNSKHSLMVVKKGAVTQRGPSPAGSIEHRKWHALKVDVKGKTVTCSIDGKVTNQGDLAANAKGTVGLGTCNTQADFKNLRVTSPDGKILLEALKAE